MSGTEEFSLLLSFFKFSKSKIERRSVGEDRHYEFLTSPMDYSTVASEDRTSEWILTEGGQKQINSGNLMYQKWAANAAQNMTAASKLNPECKPFSPTRKYNKQATDENENNLRWNQEDKLRQIWNFAKDHQQQNSKVQTNDGDNNVKPIKAIQRQQQFAMSPHEPDDYGLRSLWRNISLSSQKSDCSSTISKEDLGFTESVLRTFTSPAYAYMESPFNNSVVSPLSDSYQLPDEYLHGLCRTKGLPKIEFQKFPTDLLFFLFYTAVGDNTQLSAANQLYERGWRFNRSTGYWVARLPNINPDVRSGTYEKGVYQYFNPTSWRRETKAMTLYYSELSLANNNKYN